MSTYYRLNGEAVRQCLSSLELKQYWVAEQAGVHKSTLRRWLNGGIDRVRRQHIESLALVLSVSPNVIASPSL